MQLKNGYIIKGLHEQLPMMQKLIRLKDNKVSYQRVGDRANGLRDFLLFFDYVLTHRIEYKYCDFSETQNWIRRNFQFGEFFRLYLEVNFRISEYVKKERKARKYEMWDILKDALYEMVQIIYKEGKEKELSKIYEISKPIKINEYYRLPFSESIFYHKETLEIIDESFNEVHGIVNPDIKLLNKKPFKNIHKSKLNFTQKKDVRSIYSLSKREYDSLSKVKGNDFYTFDFTKSRTTIKQKQNNSILKKYVNTKVTLNNQAIKKTIEEYRTHRDNFIYIFSFFNLLKHYEKGDNHIVYTQKKFRLYSTNELNFGINFQSIPSIFRSVIFKGQYDYDINAGAPTLLYQYIKKKLPFENIELKYLDGYIKDRKLLRKKCAEVLSEKFGKSKKEYIKGVKQIITAMFYGSNLIYSGEDDKYEIKYYKRKYLLENVDEFKGLYDDAKELFKYFKSYINSLKVTNRKYELEEKVYIDKYELIKGKEEEKKINSIVCEIYFYLESKILLLMYETYKEDISLLIHDGFICRKDIEVEELEKLVKEKFDYDVKYSKDRL